MTPARTSLVLAVAAAFGLAAAAEASPSRAVASVAPSVVAQARGHSVKVFRSPAATKPSRVFASPNGEGTPLVFLVKSRRAGWEQVYLPVRPNGATAWVRDAAVDLSLDPYRVVVSLAGHTLTVFKAGKVIRRERAGVGRSMLPTPHGRYFVTELLKQPDPSGPYGPYAFGLSAYSEVLYSFGGGPGQIGIHGTNEPSSLGTSVSHGCVRISNAGIAWLAHVVPLGTLVEIG